MADFVQTMKDWHRMCKAYTTDDDSCCYGCPVIDFHEHGCGAIFEMDDGTDWERYEGQIREWAAEHPEPVYPTWSEWLYEQGVLCDKYICSIPELIATNVATDKVNDPIPADIARKLLDGREELSVLDSRAEGEGRLSGSGDAARGCVRRVLCEAGGADTAPGID